LTQTKQAMATERMERTSSRPSRGPFGYVDGDKGTRVSFEGTPDDLQLAMERSFTIRGAAKKPSKPVPPPPPPPTLKVKVRKNAKKRVVKVNPFDRNRDGATDAELQRASHLITNVVEVDRATQRKYSKNLDLLTRQFRDFLLLEIAPYESALDAALDDAGESLRLITGVQSASFSLGRAEQLLKRLPELKTLDWVCKRLRIPADIRELVVQEYMGASNEKHGNRNKQQQPQSNQLSQLQPLLDLLRQQERPRVRMPRS
jgi:hypothetical protein